MLCLECGRTVRQINFRHLQSCCGLTPSAYLTRHPDASLLDADVRQSLASADEKNGRWKGGVCSPHCVACGKALSHHAGLTHCVRCSAARRVNSFAGKTHTPQTREKMRQAAKTRDRSTYKAGKIAPEQNSRTRRHYWSTKSKDERAHLLSSFIEAGQRHNKRSSRTAIENAVAVMLDTLGVNYERNVQIGRYNADFRIGTVLVECYGDFWHCNPHIWDEQEYNASLHMNAGEKWRKDADRKTALQAQGYHVVCLWESDIKKEPDTILAILCRTLRSE